LAVDPIELAVEVARILERCGIDYVVGGSLASSISGEPRATLDIDIVVTLEASNVDPLLEALGDSFYADREALLNAVETRGSANLIHLPTSIKVDLFVAGGTPVDLEQLGRRVRTRVAEAPDRFLFVYTPEDILLQKLRWYRLGNEVSDRQWRDVLGIVLVQGARLDRGYLKRSAEVLGVRDLLDRALRAGSE
jgi:hypothetical protein